MTIASDRGQRTTVAAVSPVPVGAGGRGNSRLVRIWRGEAADPRWARPSLFGLLLASAVLYLYNLSASGYANSFYAAAVQAGTKSWKAFLFGSFDSSNYITVDKPPVSLWVMELSGRILGFSSWSMLAPQALEGVLAVALLYAAVRRAAGPVAGLVAGAAMALTPASALIFRFNNPDALLVLLMMAGAYCLVRALQTGRLSWLLLVGASVGFGFLTKMGQALLVVPAFGLVYLIAGPPKLGRRLIQLIAAGAAMIASAGWWVAIVQLTPASDRPYIGGSTDNNVLNLAFGYNGAGRLFGGSGNGGGGAPVAAGGGSGRAASAAGSSFGGATGLRRLFSGEMGLEISWLLPAALIALVAGLWLTRRAPRTDLTRASLVLWGGWLLLTGLVFSYMQGTIHPYYTVALAPAIVALVTVTARLIWVQRRDPVALLAGAAMIICTGLWTHHLLVQNASWYPGLRWAAVALAVFGGLALLMVRHWTRAALVAGVAAGAVLLSGSGAYALATTAVAHSGSIPSVGPTVGGAAGPGGSGGPGAGGFGPGGIRPGGSGSGSGSTSGGVSGSAAGGGPTGSAPLADAAAPTGGTGAASPTGAGGSTAGGDAASSALVALLRASSAKWAAAADSSMSAGGLELSSGKAVMSIGGFNGSDNAITLAQFKVLVAKGEIGYFIPSGGGAGAGGAGGASNGVFAQISIWVSSTFTAKTVGSTTVYDLTAAK